MCTRTCAVSSLAFPFGTLKRWREPSCAKSSKPGTNKHGLRDLTELPGTRFNDGQSGLERSTLTHTQRLEASSHKSTKCSSIPATAATAWLTFGWSWEGPLPDCLFTGYPLPRLPHWARPSTWPHQKPKEMSSVEPHSTISLSLP